jgi:tetrahydromethanopterin S-methyltransferase subunit G
MSDQEYREIIERLTRIEEKVTNVTSSNKEVKDLVIKHEADIQKAKGVILFLGFLTSISAIKSFLFK